MQLYARIFLTILDSSIAENWKTRHVFEDMLKLVDRNGVLDMTHEAISRRCNLPLDMVREAITDLESPDRRSRDGDSEGRRIVRLDAHRDWGWKIVNWEKYESIKTKADAAVRQAKFKANLQESLPLLHTSSSSEEKTSDTDSDSGKKRGVTRRNGEVTQLMAENMYEEYPRKVAKRYAISKIMAAIHNGNDPVKMLEATKKFAASWRGCTSDDLRFCPHPATWFNQERFNDDPSTWVRSTKEPEQRTWLDDDIAAIKIPKVD